MKKIAVALITLNLITGATEMKKLDSFKKVWSEVSAKPLETLPQEKISLGSLFTWSKNIILQNAKRTLESRDDILPYFDKLAHPNGICLKGTWKIHKETPYSGYFKNFSEALIIARASSAMSNTKSGEIRAFGLAGKLFPTTSPTKQNSESTANFFVIDDLGGTDAKHFTDVALTNEPTVTTTSEVMKNLLYALKVAKAFGDADSHSGIRQLYEISELGEHDKSMIRTPKWIKITAQKGQGVDAKDFRDELKINGKNLMFDIAVASKKDEWNIIGTIVFDASVVSTACDHRLHFHHPKWKDIAK
jgi:hypothetical protein